MINFAMSLNNSEILNEFFKQERSSTVFRLLPKTLQSIDCDIFVKSVIKYINSEIDNNIIGDTVVSRLVKTAIEITDLQYYTH